LIDKKYVSFKDISFFLKNKEILISKGKGFPDLNDADSI